MWSLRTPSTSLLPATFTQYFHQTAHLTSTAHLCRHSPTHYYDVLGITPKATHKQIKDAFYRLSKTHHPDMSGDIASVGKFQEISEAYEVLGNHFSRKKYDRGLLNPIDPRSQHTASREDNSETGFHPRKYQKRESVYTGKTKYYNFDEYYRQHYGEQVLQQFKKKKYGTTQNTPPTAGQGHNAQYHPTYDSMSMGSMMSSPSGVFMAVGLGFLAFFVLVLDSDFIKDLESTPCQDDNAVKKSSNRS